MKVHELIEKLKELQQDYEVIMFGGQEIGNLIVLDHLCGHDNVVLMLTRFER